MRLFKKKTYELPEWQTKLLENPLVDKNKFIENYSIKKISKMDLESLKFSLKFFTKFSYEEQCEFYPDKVFEGVYELDIVNADYLSYYLIQDRDSMFYIFSNKCGRANFTFYIVDSPYADFLDYDEENDKYKPIKNMKLFWNAVGDNRFSMRLKDLSFTHQFLENLIQEPIKLK
jgi:hypothetical protein